MNIKELHNDLIQAYSVSNLNTISLTLINLFKSKQYTALQKITDLISDFVEIQIGDDGKGFYKLMMLYHPDRSGYHVREINRLAGENDFKGLMSYSHIMKLDRIGEIATVISNYEDIDYSPVYEWDIDTEGFRIFNINDPPEKEPSPDTLTKPAGCTFYEAMQIREFGDIDAEYILFYLQDIEDFELSSSGINDLDGVQFCTHARTIDLSNNSISDLLPLIGLRELEELNLSDNEVGFIDDLSCLGKLKSVILSNNNIDDISPLFELTSLEYADLSGNRIEMGQINILAGMGVTVDY